VIAHTGHWLTTVAYLAPVIAAVGGLLIARRIRRR
jgi:hypothetical protein